MSVLRIEELTAGYQDAMVLRDVSLAIDDGEAVALIGRNGAGKSTLLHSIFGGTTIRAGAIMLGERNVVGLPGYMAARLGAAITPQGRQILPNLSVRQNLLLGQANGRVGPWDLEAVHGLFPALADKASNRGNELSGGQQQMLAIGRALLGNPSVLLLDEPSEGLAPVLLDQICDALARVREQGTSLLIVEQRLDLVERIADRYIVLSKGRLAEHGDVRTAGLERLRAAIAI